MPTVVQYIEDVEADKTIDSQEKESQIKELQENITKLEDDKKNY